MSAKEICKIRSIVNKIKPLVFVAVLVRDKEYILDPWLQNLESQDYPKNRIILYIHANNSTDKTVEIMKDFAEKNRCGYYNIIEDYGNDNFDFTGIQEHDWEVPRRHLIARLREKSIKKCLETLAEFFFTYDVDNFIKSFTLSKLIEHDKEFVSPLLTSPDNPNWANFFFKATPENGYRDPKSHDLAMIVTRREIVGLIAVDVAHCSYLIKRSTLKKLTYINGSNYHEFIILSQIARDRGITQFIDNTFHYGFIIMKPEQSGDALKMLNNIPEH